MDVVAEIERLTQRRQTLTNEIAGIDVQMERVRAALGLAPPKVHRPSPETAVYHRRTFRSVNGTIPNAVMAALEESEPQSVFALAKTVGTAVTTMNQYAAALVRYARSEAAFATTAQPANGSGHDTASQQQADASITSEAADELG